MSIIDSLLSLVAPHQCLGCSREGSILCLACSSQLSATTEYCYYCQRPSKVGLTCTECYRRAYLFQVRAATAYRGLAKELVRKLKFSGAQAAVKPMTVAITRLLREITTASAATATTPTERPLVSVIAPVPTVTVRQRRRGYDQACLLARALARRQGVGYVP